MGGGRSQKPETRKSAVLSHRPEHLGGEAGGGIHDLTLPLCEREQKVAFQIEEDAEIEPGEIVRIVRADPPALVVGGKTIGWVSGRRQAQTLAACLDAGYLLSGEITMIDKGVSEGFAAVVGIRA